MIANQHPLDALGDPTRRRVFELLQTGPASVGSLAAELPVSRPAVSQHLKVLEQAGLVTHTRDGARHLYAVAPDGLGALRTWIEGFWTDALDRYAVAATRKEQ